MQVKKLLTILVSKGAQIDFIHGNEILFHCHGKYRIYYDYSDKNYSLCQGYRGDILIDKLPFKDFRYKLEKFF